MIVYRWYKYKNRVRGKVFVFTFRGVTRHELHIASTKENNFKAQNYLVKQSVQEEIDVDNLPAGVIELLIENILRVSGITEEQKTWVEALAWIQTEEGEKQIMAMSVFPWCSKEYLDHCDPSYYAAVLMAGKACFDNALGGLVQGTSQIGSSTIKNPEDPRREHRVTTDSVKFK